MKKTFILSFSLKNTYRVNGILYSLKQIPLVKRLLPEALYGVWGLKIFANILSAIWEVVSVFLGKGLYLLLMVFLPGLLYDGLPGEGVFLHILLFLTVIGCYANIVDSLDTKRLFESLYCPCFLCGAPSAQSAAPSISEVLALLFADNFTFEHGVEEWFCWLQFHELHSMLS